jgi:hypothetical protein
LKGLSCCFRSLACIDKVPFDDRSTPGSSAIQKSASTASDQICDIRLGQDVALARLKGEDAELEEAQEHVNSSSLALYA